MELKYTVVIANSSKSFKDEDGQDDLYKNFLFGKNIDTESIFENFKKIFNASLSEPCATTKFSESNKEVDFYLMIVSMKELCSKHFYNALAESGFRKKDETTDYVPKPIIFIGIEELYNKPVENKKSLEDYFNIDKRKGFLDSSIWHYYVAIKPENFKKRLCDTVCTIANNKRFELYNTVVAKEYLEFQVRLMKNSYLKKIGGGHADHITPFVFHSETVIKRKADKALEALQEKYNYRIQWNVLIVDDFALEKLKKGDDEKEVIKKSKTDIIKYVLKDFDEDNTEFKYEFIYDGTGAKVLECFKKKLQKPDIQYDVLLLDFLLDEKDEKRQLSSEIFMDSKPTDLFKYKGPMGKFWILPITSFSKAMLDRITNEGISRITDDWYLFDGADPIATPELFRYYIIQLIELQLNSAIVTKEKMLKDLASGYNEDIHIRTFAKLKYGSFMHKFGLREYLKQDAKKESVFAKSVLAYINKEKEDDLLFYEQLRKLLYLIGFGTQADVPRIWRCLKYLNTNLPMFGQDDKDIEKDIKTIFKKIIIFINELD